MCLDVCLCPGRGRACRAWPGSCWGRSSTSRAGSAAATGRRLSPTDRWAYIERVHTGCSGRGITAIQVPPITSSEGRAWESVWSPIQVRYAATDAIVALQILRALLGTKLSQQYGRRDMAAPATETRAQYVECWVLWCDGFWG